MTRALIADDNADNLYLLRVLFQGHGYIVDEARDGREALTKACEHPPDVIVSDLLMPHMDGYSLLRAWKSDLRLRDVPFIVYTATYTEPSDERLALDLGADAFLLKPAEPELFMSKVRQVLARALSKASVSAPNLDERTFLEDHSHVVVRKLEKKARLLDDSNRELRVEVAEHKRTEVALRDSETRYKALFHAIGDPLFVYDRETSAYLDVNAAAIVHYGYSRDEFLSMTFGDIALPDEVGPPSEPHAPGSGSHDALGTRQHRKKNGDVIHVEVATYDFDYAGRPARVAHARDVTAQRRTAADVAQKTALLQAVANGTSDLVFVKDRDGKYLLFNEAASRFLGRPTSDVLGKEDTALWSSVDAEQIRATDRLVLDSQVRHTVEETLSAGGKRCTFQTVKAPYRDLDGEVIGIIGVSRDISERKRAEETLLLRDRAIQAVSQGILITDAGTSDHAIVYASAGFCRMTQYSVEDVIGSNCRFLQGKDTDPEAVREVREAIAARRSCTVELINYRKDGAPFWNHLEISPVWDTSGRLTHFVGVQTDVTERRRLESQFRQSQKMEAIGRLAGGIAHDFNNLLTVINIYSAALQEQLAPNDPMVAPLTEIRKAGERAGTLTRQLLMFSRQQVLESKLMSVGSVIRDSESMLRRLIGEDVILVTSVGTEPDWVRTDPGQLIQVLLNFAINARDAMPRGGRLTIESETITLDEVYCRAVGNLAPGDYVLLSVSDTGCGMNDEVLARIFEPFFTTKEPGKGTGLGLPTVHGIIRQSRGHVSVYSEVGFGTTFKVYLPRILGAAPTDAVPPLVLPMPSGTETILLVEDEDSVRDLATSILRGCGYRVLSSSNGKEAVDLAMSEREPIHLLISDVVMPHLSGRALAERIAEERPNCQVLFLSGYTNDAVIRHGVLEAEFNFLQKPFTAVSLAQKVRHILDGRLPKSGKR